jgi:hypothetical protein
LRRPRRVQRRNVDDIFFLFRPYWAGGDPAMVGQRDAAIASVKTSCAEELILLQVTKPEAGVVQW